MRSTAYAWYVAVVLAAGYFVSVVDRFLMSVAMVPLRSALSLSDTQLGMLHGLGFALLYVVATPVFGRLADVSNRRTLIVLGILAWTIASVACGFADTFATLFAARVGVGLAEAALLPAGMSLIVAYFAKEQIGRATSVFIMGGNLGALGALVGGGLLLEHFTTTGGLRITDVYFAPWQALFVIGSLPGLLVAALLLTVREPVRDPVQRAAQPGIVQAFAEMRRRWSVYARHFGYSACAILIAGAIVAWSTSFYVRSHGLGVGRAALLAGLCGGLGGISGLALGGAAMDWLRKRSVQGAPALIIGTSLVLAVPAVAVFALADNLALSLAGYLLASVILQATPAAAYAGLQLLAPDSHRGTITGLFLAVLTIGNAALGPVCIGFLNDRVFQSEQGLGPSLVVATLIFSLIGAWAAFSVRKVFDRSRAESGPAVAGAPIVEPQSAG